MEQQSYQIEVDHLAIGLTKPAVYMGIDMRFFFMNLIVGTLSCLYSKSLYGILLSVIAYIIMRQLSQKDIKIFALYWTYFQVSMPRITYGFWGGTNSYQPW